MTENEPAREPGASDYEFITLEKLAAPSTGTFFERYAGHWWVVAGEKGAAFYNPALPGSRRRHRSPGIPVCNASEEIARSVAGRQPFPAQVTWVPVAWVPIEPWVLGA